MNQSIANRIRRLHKEGKSRRELCIEFGITKRVLYLVLDNQTFPQSGYEKRKTPKKVLLEYGLPKLLKLWDDGYKIKDIQKVVQDETGCFINLGTLRWNIEDYELKHAIACQRALS